MELSFKVLQKTQIATAVLGISLALLIAETARGTCGNLFDPLQRKPIGLDQETFGHIRNVAVAFMNTFPPEEYYYVGFGRSPHAILAYVEALGGGDVRYIPMSNGKFHFKNPNEVDIRTPERERIVKDHVRSFLPTEGELNGRKLLGIDFVDTGLGFGVAHYYFVETLFEMGFDLSRVATVGLGLDRDRSQKVWRTQSREEQIDIPIHAFNSKNGGGDSFGTLSGIMTYRRNGWLQHYAPVGRFDLATLKKGDDYSESRPEYSEFLALFRQF